VAIIDKTVAAVVFEQLEADNMQHRIWEFCHDQRQARQT
jgi:hypothetical protein